MLGKTLAAAMLLTGCATTFVKEDLQDSGKAWTIGREVGMAPSLYQAAYERQADKQCPNGFIVLEKSYWPSTLKEIGVERSDSLFYWVIRCK